MDKTPKELVGDVLSIPTTKKLWSVTYPPALPFTPQNFTIGAVLPAVLYMFRWGHRRGTGVFEKTYSEAMENGIIKPVTIEAVTNKIVRKSDWFSGFESPASKAILGDMIFTMNTKLIAKIVQVS